MIYPSSSKLPAQDLAATLMVAETPNQQSFESRKLNSSHGHAFISKLAFYFFTFQGFSAFFGFHKKSKVRK